jgi:hypothetical protein
MAAISSLPAAVYPVVEADLICFVPTSWALSAPGVVTVTAELWTGSGDDMWLGDPEPLGDVPTDLADFYYEGVDLVFPGFWDPSSGRSLRKGFTFTHPFRGIYIFWRSNGAVLISRNEKYIRQARQTAGEKESGVPPSDFWERLARF